MGRDRIVADPVRVQAGVPASESIIALLVIYFTNHDGQYSRISRIAMAAEGHQVEQRHPKGVGARPQLGRRAHLDGIGDFVVREIAPHRWIMLPFSGTSVLRIREAGV